MRTISLGFLIALTITVGLFFAPGAISATENANIAPATFALAQSESGSLSFGVVKFPQKLPKGNSLGGVGSEVSGELALPKHFSRSAESPQLTYFPLVFKNAGKSFELTAAWTTDSAGASHDIHFLGETILYKTAGHNSLGTTAATTLSWQIKGPCGPSEVFSDSVDFPPGAWTHTYTSTVPVCVGDYQATVQAATDTYTASLRADFTAHFPSLVQVSTGHGFDRCNLPTVEQMKTWWDDSPYMAFNVYLGGIHFPCSLANLTPDWLSAVAQQGWDFIFTWVGPQAACSNFLYKMSADPDLAFGQGITEAAAALDAAEALGLSGEKIIYYDLEAYSAPDDELPACRQAAAAFIDGWTTWLQLQGYKAGAYGSPCNSYMPDWAANSPPPDDVWIAHWLLPPKFRPAASVWDVACMSNDYWPDNQRLRQYAGDHPETWGDLALTIDSNVLQGEITSIPRFDEIVAASLDARFREADIQAADFLTPKTGFVLNERSLLRTDDGGKRWRQISPDFGASAFLDMEILDSVSGWLLAKRVKPGFRDFVSVSRTRDGGATWETHTLPVSPEGVSDGYLDFIDARYGWLVLKTQSGSSFSLGRLFASIDGGQTWEERAAPLGEPVAFIDRQRGWMAGGPTGDQLFRSDDGGETWGTQELPGRPAGQISVGLPQFADSQTGTLPVTVVADSGTSLVVYRTLDGGETWFLSENTPVNADQTPGAPLSFSAGESGWWSASPDNDEIIASKVRTGSRSLPAAGLPPGTISLDFVTDRDGWAVVQNGGCSGQKYPVGQPIPAAAAPLICSSGASLYTTNDGGLTWQIVPVSEGGN